MCEIFGQRFISVFDELNDIYDRIRDQVPQNEEILNDGLYCLIDQISFKKLQEGDSEVWENFYGLAFRLTIRVASNFKDQLDPTDFEDIFQDVCYKLLSTKSPCQQQACGTSFAAWLIKVIRNTCLDYLRRKKRVWARQIYFDVSRDNDENFDLQNFIPSSTEPIGEKIKNAEKVKDLFLFLGKENSLIFNLLACGYSYEEIANYMGMSVSKIKSVIHRIRRSVREAFSND
ncbi:MAG: RNA polymerase sigma factor [Patescibacteria group bacterium]|nr:RNA polymerase sigma factor [Patescibacteria group bacterium]